MKRRELLTNMLGGVVALAVPGGALASTRRRRGGGFKTIPYVPRDAVPYYDPMDLPRVMKKDPSAIDNGIWPAVRRINESGWVWTAESCEGHQGGPWWQNPEIRLVCRATDAPAMLDLLVRVNRYDLDEHDDPRPRTSVEIWRHGRPPTGWFEVRVVVRTYPRDVKRARRVFEVFAEAVNG